MSTEDGLETSGSPADEDVNAGKSSNPDDEQGGESSTSQQEPASMEEAVAKSLAAKPEGEEGEPAAAPGGEAEGGGEGGEGDAKKLETDTDKDKKPETEEELYKLPEDVKSAKGRERFEKIVASHKEATAKLESLNKEVQSFYQVLETSGASPKEFQDLIMFSHNVKAGNTDQALEFIERMRTELARQAGKPLPGVDLLEGYDDLKAEVEEMKISPERAIELAKVRRDQERRQQAEDADKAQQDQQATANAEIEQGKTDIRAKVAEWKKNDIDFPAKLDLIIEKAQSLGDIPPALWARTMEIFYDGLSHIKATPKPTNRPLSNQGGGGGSREASSMEDAIGLALKKTAG